MRRLPARTPLVIASFVFVVVAAANVTAGTLDELAWLKGCWSSAKPGKRQTTEHWMAPAGGTMLGMNRTLKGGKTIEFEFMRIAQEANGDIYFIANPSGQAQARFKLIKGGDKEVVFENPDHDFPQQIIYRLQEDGTLLGRVEGMSKGHKKAVDFPMQKTSCD